MNEWLFWALAACLTSIVVLGLTGPLRPAAGAGGARLRVWLVIILVPVASVALYVFLGRPDLLNH